MRNSSGSINTKQGPAYDLLFNGHVALFRPSFGTGGGYGFENLGRTQDDQQPMVIGLDKEKGGKHRRGQYQKTKSPKSNMPYKNQTFNTKIKHAIQKSNLPYKNQTSNINTTLQGTYRPTQSLGCQRRGQFDYTGIRLFQHG